jgi:hypothetical protein
MGPHETGTSERAAEQAGRRAITPAASATRATSGG